jgi:hypothetical protein
MNEQALKRYQAGRCDAHGNRMIAFDRCYLRGYFAALMDLPDGRNPFLWKEGTAVCPLDRINYRRACIHIDRQVDDFQDIRNYNLHKFAFERGREAL